MNLVENSIIQYCERVGSSFFSEPINFISNIAFFFAAYFSYKLFKKHQLKDKKYTVLAFLVGLIGVGSFAWHSFRSPLTHAMDFIPIFAFFLLFLYLVIEKLTNSRIKALLITTVFLYAHIQVSLILPHLFNGSFRHVMNMLFYIRIIAVLFHKKSAATLPAVKSLAAYGFATIFRSIDGQVCASFPVGTHFLWHILTATAAYFAIKTLVLLVRDTTK